MEEIINKANRVDSVYSAAELVNEEHGIDGAAEVIASAFVIAKADRNGEGLTELVIEDLLYELSDCGADFHHARALELAMKNVI